MALIFVLLIFALSAFFVYHFYWKRRNLPPGPTPLPFIGNVHQIKRNGDTGERAFLEWRRQYGPVYTYWLGEMPIVCVADYQRMVDMFVRDGDTYSDRVPFPFENLYRERLFKSEEPLGVIGAVGHRWREQRRFALQVLRDFGLSKNLMQERILDELASMFRKIDAQLLADSCPSEESNLMDLVDVSVGSVINSVMFGYRLEGPREAEFWEIKHLVQDHMKAFSSPLALFYILYPHLLGKIPFFSYYGKRLHYNFGRFFAFFEKKIVEHQKELENESVDSPPKDYVEAFLKEMERRKSAGEDDHDHYFSINQLSHMCFDLWVAGQETSTTVLGWCIAYLVNRQDCQQRLQREMDAVVGSDRMVLVADRPNLPYTNAVVNESLRIANLIPMNLNRGLTKPVELDGYLLPVGTCLQPQISAVLIDDTIFAEPHQFKPERYLDEAGRLKRCDELIPFSIGKRQCLGESLARMELFLFIANIFNRYSLTPGKVAPSLTRKDGGVIQCEPFTCRIEKRTPNVDQ